MSSTSRSISSKKPGFSVFSDENEGVKSKITSSQKSSASVSSLPVPSKRIKMAPPSTGLYAASTAMNKSSLPLTYNNNNTKPRTALSTKSVTVLADKENLDPTGKRKVNDKGKEKVKDNSKISSSKPDLWQGKQPFEYASPEKIPTSSRTSSKTTSTKYIYDLPGVQACEHVTSKNASQTFLKPTSMRTIGSGIAVSKPNKKIRPAVPAPLKKTGAFEIFKDDGMTGSGRETFAIPRAASTSTLAPVNRDLELLGNQQAIAMRSPVSSIQASDRRARELTESPLADVTLAYTGNGRFSNSPTADSGFGSRETSVSPLPSARSFAASRSKLSTSPLQAYQDAYLESIKSSQLLGETEDSSTLPNALGSLTISSNYKLHGSPKRRISQLPSLSRSEKTPSSSNVDKEPAYNVQNTSENAELADLESQHFADEHVDSQSESESEEEEEEVPTIPTLKETSHRLFTKATLAPLQPQSSFGKKTSIPTRKPLNMRI